MARIRIPLIYGHFGLIPLAPAFTTVPNSLLPNDGVVTDGHSLLVGATPAQIAAANPTALVDVPDEDCTGGALDNAKVKARYPNHWLVTGGHFG